MDLIKKMCGSFDFTAISAELYALLPQDKMDVERAKKAVDYGYPGVAPILPVLIYWMQDLNWPVAQELAPFLAQIGAPLKQPVLYVLKSQDTIWKYWVISQLVNTDDLRLAKAIGPELQHLQLKTAGSADEDDLSVHAVTTDVLNKLQAQHP
ncbi:DUF5071 domain-containing protein [Hafnia paralvei]|uniref:DUF5071 domain-containing protein n=1 Tax=Hafnia paralvei TaxID=546367 RepID=UPI0001F06775|nr:DUF5071 domain-containing protein [Hafnia paralvei]EFV41922.1 hypothetical protein HMPREF0864_00251 [Enterobacteriaceae bacterium 9_2_54FAA]MBW2958908.1 DUF5071 domain-containing protein [Hafnia paralvei]MCQ4169534.1 DUF5071 domain-containing protein [Hafnia paralvei]TBM32005.1 DUF5071 domain-containing protein [Hafnia paralvei]